MLFHGVFLPLHVFEPRYRAMIADALASDRMIGMVLLRDGWEGNYEGRPPVYSVGCSGVITHCEQLPDGRYNIILRGVERFRISEEDQSRAYRRAVIQPLPERELTSADRLLLRAHRARLEALLAPSTTASGLDARAASAMSDEDLVNALAQYLDLAPIEKQALLEQPTVLDRAQALAELLEMKVMMAKATSGSRLSH